MLWAQITIAIWLVFRLAINAVLNGKKTDKEWSFPVALVDVGITTFFLWKAGAFTRLFQ